MRKLASIQKIELLEPIENADFILKARIMGWDVVVKKGEFKEKDLCVFLEVDSLLPDGESWSEFMRSKKFRVKTCKLRGVLSQGLAFPIAIIPNYEQRGFKIGDDVTELLNIKKYEPPLHHGGPKLGNSRGNFPHFVPKTHETRIQSCLRVLEEIKNKKYFISVKCDGTSATYAYNEDEFLACSRNWAKKEDDTNIYWKMARKYDLAEKLKQNKNLAIQGEICGPSIQKNPLMLTDIDLFVFTVYDIEKKRRLPYSDFIRFCKDLCLNVAPIEEVGNEFNYSLNELLEKAKGFYRNTKRRREGIVVRTQENVYSQTLQGPLSFKVINNDFLLKDEK